MNNQNHKTESDNADCLQRLVGALEEIRKMAMDHPCFDADCFERRDIDGLCDQGGDICDWTMVAIHADDAIRANDRTELPTGNGGGSQPKDSNGK